MQIVSGDILAIDKGIIVHQVNCKKVMGAGLALQIRKKYPQHFADFLSTEPKLGNIVTTRINDNLYIVGVYGQVGYGRTGRYTNYSALHAGLVKVNMLANQKQLPIFVPFGIGCGLAGGDWNQVMKMLSSVNNNIVVVRKAKDEEDAVAFWHEHETGNTLMEYMQMTKEEYEAFLKR